MFISKIIIKGFRNFKEAEIPFHEGVNVIIGHNNTGKSNLLRAMALVLGYYDSRSLRTSDLFYETDLAILQNQSPRFSIQLIFHKSEDEPVDSDEMGLFAGMMIDQNLDTEAMLSYEYCLTETEEANYLAEVANATSAKEVWKIIDHDYFRFYSSNRYGGNRQAGIDTKGAISRIDFQFLDAIRDISRDLYAGYSHLLKDVLNFFIDYQVKNDDSKTDEEKNEELKNLRNIFLSQSTPVLSLLKNRLQDGQNIFLNYATNAGATFNGAFPDFDGEVTENEMFSALRLMIKYDTGIEIPAIYNGLGYNNLIYMSLLLAKMQAESSSSYMKRQAKVLSFLAVEECEAHLHPAMQYKFLQFLQDTKVNNHIRQAFITTHSTQITSAVTIDDIICLTTPRHGVVDVGYPRIIFKNNTEHESKKFVQRFLDATKADMFFANKLIFVEGIAEELLLPIFAKYLGWNLIDEHVLVVNMGGRYFHHFLKMFDTNNDYAINKRIVCLTDIDPVEKKAGDNQDFEACYPYEYNMVEGSTYAHHADESIAAYATHPNIRFFRQDATFGKTLEYDLMRENDTCELLLTSSVTNQREIKSLMAEPDINNMLGILRNSEENNRIKRSIMNSGWDVSEKRKAIIASRYLNSVKKGSNALELNVALEDNLNKPIGQKEEFHVPHYIEDALRWLLQ